MGRKLCTVLCGEGNVRQLTRFPHFVKPISDMCQLCLIRIFVQEVGGYRDMADFLDSCGTQEPAVTLQELPHAVGGILLVEEEFRSGVPPPFEIWVVDVEE